MTTPAAQPVTPGQSLPWSQVWRYAVTRPSEQSYEVLLSDPGAKPARGLLWVGITSLFTTAIYAVTQIAFRPEMEAFMRRLGGEATSGSRLSAVAFALICGVPIGAVLAVVGTVVYTWIVNLIAGMLGGTGSYNNLLYLNSAITAPMGVASSLLSIIPIVSCLTLPLGIYSIYLQALAVKTVHRVDWTRAVVSVLALVFLAVLIAVVCAIAILIPLFGEAMRSSF